ncbi:DUF982 domain-containing protein, partial [Mesorhizobium sp. M1340]|uniref:DUF982 domain-containing protein n=1 Tax=Mesorhizobium sp. M1340 TaxID=2957087 RepID=UPI00333C293B
AVSAHLLPSQGVHLFWWTPHASEHSTAKGAGKFALTLNVNNVEAAGQELMKWTKRGPCWEVAVRVCMAVIFDEMEAEEARKAFLAAAEEEGAFPD